MSKQDDQYDLTANIQDVLNVLQTPGDAGENPEPDEEALETIHVYPVEGGGILFTRTPIEPLDDDLDTPIPTRPAPQPTATAAIGVWLFGLLVPLFCIAVQLYFILNPFTVTLTLAARAQQLSLTGTLQQGRVLNPITLSQSQTVPTTGRGHQDAKAATGFITFYNGQPAQQFVPAGTLLTSVSGMQIVTTQDATIPAADLTANPPVFGQTTIPAQAVSKGSKGNIPAYDMNETCCATSVVAKNTNAFTGGQDERNFQTVAKSDIDNTAAPLKATLAQSVNGALQGQLKNNEAFVTPSCATTITSDHQIGQEATTVKVTASETCSAIAYNSQELTNKVTQLLTAQATTKLGAGYSILENPQITITSATTSKPVMLSFTSISTWVYALTTEEQKHIKKIIAGNNTAKALQLLHSLPGIEHVSLQFSGFGDDTRIPKNMSNIHLLIFYGG